MDLKFYILILLISTIICTPPPIPQPPYEVSVEEPIPEEIRQNSSNFKNLQESNPPQQFVNSTNVEVKILENGVLEEHEVNVTTKNLESGFYSKYSFSIILPEGKSLELQSNECHKLKLSGTNTDKDECIVCPIEKDNNIYRFSYNYTLYKEEFMIINYKILITSQNPEILYRQETISVSKIYSGGFCDYKFILPDNYINLGLKDNNFTKESDKIYFYKGECPSEQINDVARLAPKESYWKADYSNFLETQQPHSNKITFKCPRMYKGGKNHNKNYKITTHENEVLKESELIKDEVFLNVEVSGKNNNKVGFNIHTAFSNKLDDRFDVYTSANFYDIDSNNIDNTIKAKAEEIINDPNSKYKDYPNYYKIGKFVHSHITYDLSYHGKNKTALEIYNEKKGVCEHYTILYNAMLNAIGIKTIKTFGWALDKDKTSANQDTIGHAWSVILDQDKFIELDATWDLFEGVPAGHILKGFNREICQYSMSGPDNVEIKGSSKIDNLQLVNNLDDEEEDSNTEVPVSQSNLEENEAKSSIPNQEENDAKSSIPNQDENDDTSSEAKDSIENGSENEPLNTTNESKEEESDNGRNINTSIYLLVIPLLLLF